MRAVRIVAATTLVGGMIAVAGTSPSVAVPAPAVAATITMPKNVGFPTFRTSVSGSGFGASETVDVAFDATSVTVAATDAAGVFTKAKLTIPAAATPGAHLISATGRTSRRSAQVSFTVNTNWEQFHSGANRSGFNRLENVLNPATVGGLAVKWAYDTGAGVSSPVVVAGVVYVTSGGNVLAINASTGDLLWSTGALGLPSLTSIPAVVGSVVYASGPTGVFALTAASAAVLWIYPSPGGAMGMAVADGVVYVETNCSECAGGEYWAVALDAATGVQLWGLGPNVCWVENPPAVAGGIAYFTDACGRVVAVDKVTGTELWRFRAVDWISSAPAVVGSALYVVDASGNFYTLNASTGALLWARTIFASTYTGFGSSPAVAGGIVYVGGDVDPYVYALQARTGKTLWSYSTGSYVFSSPAVANGVVYVGSEDQALYALNAATGAKLWSSTTGAGVSSSPAVVNGVVYIGSNDGKVYAFALP